MAIAQEHSGVWLLTAKVLCACFLQIMYSNGLAWFDHRLLAKIFGYPQSQETKWFKMFACIVACAGWTGMVHAMCFLTKMFNNRMNCNMNMPSSKIMTNSFLFLCLFLFETWSCNTAMHVVPGCNRHGLPTSRCEHMGQDPDSTQACRRMPDPTSMMYTDI